MTYIKILLFLCLLSACTSIDTTHPKQVKPKNIPDGSFWAGGVDGGNWYYVKYINNHRNMARIAVYNDQNGSLLIDTNFMLICNVEKYTFINDLKQQISSFDGNKIYLTKSDRVDCFPQPIN